MAKALEVSNIWLENYSTAAQITTLYKNDAVIQFNLIQKSANKVIKLLCNFFFFYITLL